MVRHRLLSARAGGGSLRPKVAAVAAAGLLIAVAGCSSVTTSGTAIADPGRPLTATLERLKQDNKAGIEQGSTTVGEATHCFYQLPEAEADDVTNEVACGPIRRLGKPTEQAWDVYRLTYTQAADGQLTGAIDKLWKSATAVDTSLLVAPDDTEPATVDQIPEPQAPPTTVTNTATMLSENSAGAKAIGELTKLKKPVRLLTPSASIEVTAMSEAKLLPKEVVEAEQKADTPTPVYRPAEGQTAYALQVTVGPGTDGSKLLSTSAESRLTSLSTALSIRAGKKKIAIADDSTIPQDPDADTLTVPCQSEDGESFPCRSDRTDQGVLVMTVPAGVEPTLVAAAGDHRQAVELPDGKLSSKVSQLEYERTAEPVKVAKTVKIGPVRAAADEDKGKKGKDKKDKKDKKGKKDKLSSSWKFDVDSAGLAAFDPYRGWAPAGKAWLVVATSGYQQSGKGEDAWKTERVGSVSLEVDGKSVEPNGLSEGYFDGRSDADVNWVFEVPTDLKSAKLSFQPTGVFTGGKKDKDFSTKSAETLKLTFEK